MSSKINTGLDALAWCSLNRAEVRQGETLARGEDGELTMVQGVEVIVREPSGSHWCETHVDLIWAVRALAERGCRP